MTLIHIVSVATLSISCGGRIERTNTHRPAEIFVAEGDSLTRGVRGELVWARQLSLPDSTERHNVATSGETLRGMLNQATDQVDSLLRPGGSGIAALWAGTNDLWGRKEDPVVLADELVAWCQGRQRAGFRTVVLSVIRRGNAADRYQQDFEARRVAYNALARARSSEGCDAYVDLDGLPGTPGDGVIYAEFVHLTTAGQRFVAERAQEAIDGL